MSGHSKWSQIKHKKALTDAKKGKLFSKIALQISVAAREKGGDPSSNFNLRMLMDKARSFNMPQDNVERAIKRGTGEIEGAKIEELVLEAYGPAGIAIIIEAITDNKNRTIPEIKHLLSQNNGKLGETGSVNYLFEKRGVLIFKKTGNTEELEMIAIEAGAEDIKERIKEDEKFLEIYTKPENLKSAKTALSAKKIKIESESLEYVPKAEIKIADPKSKEQAEKLLESLEENEDVNEIYSNMA